MAKNPPTSHIRQPTEFSLHSKVIRTTPRTNDNELLTTLSRIQKNSVAHHNVLNNINNSLLSQLNGKCLLEDELKQNHQTVLIMTKSDAFSVLKSLIEDRYIKEHAIPSTLILRDIDKARNYSDLIQQGAEAYAITRAFGDFGVRATLSEINGKMRVAISTKANGQQMLRHVLVKGMRLKVNGKKTYAINNPKVVQLGLAPKSRISAGIKAGAFSMIISAAINTNDLIFNDDYHFVDWFGNIGSDFIKTALSIYGGEFIIGLFVGATGALPLVIIAGISITIAILLDEVFEATNIAGELTNALKKNQQ
ncbi:hypothetical protein [Photobacterium damselae]|uniref:hypothetical protein n=1 Tax=Photobacterium damselae TaxID=38293 RepID=UPI0015946CCC|nr:hypothetical protein [Photobacterium damselae]NVH47347.1 hypothetical protein [Photobacterium damselae subsp. damselae]